MICSIASNVPTLAQILKSTENPHSYHFHWDFSLTARCAWWSLGVGPLVCLQRLLMANYFQRSFLKLKRSIVPWLFPSYTHKISPAPAQLRRIQETRGARITLLMLAVLLWAYVAKKYQDNTGKKLQATEWWEMLIHFSHAWPCRALQHVLDKFLTALLWLLEVFRTAYQCYKQQCLIFITSL